MFFARLIRGLEPVIEKEAVQVGRRIAPMVPHGREVLARELIESIEKGPLAPIETIVEEARMIESASTESALSPLVTKSAVSAEETIIDKGTKEALEARTKELDTIIDEYSNQIGVSESRIQALPILMDSLDAEIQAIDALEQFIRDVPEDLDIWQIAQDSNITMEFQGADENVYKLAERIASGKIKLNKNQVAQIRDFIEKDSSADAQMLAEVNDPWVSQRSSTVTLRDRTIAKGRIFNRLNTEELVGKAKLKKSGFTLEGEAKQLAEWRVDAVKRMVKTDIPLMMKTERGALRKFEELLAEHRAERETLDVIIGKKTVEEAKNSTKQFVEKLKASFNAVGDYLAEPKNGFAKLGIGLGLSVLSYFTAITGDRLVWQAFTGAGVGENERNEYLEYFRKKIGDVDADTKEIANEVGYMIKRLKARDKDMKERAKKKPQSPESKKKKN